MSGPVPKMTIVRQPRYSRELKSTEEPEVYKPAEPNRQRIKVLLFQQILFLISKCKPLHMFLHNVVV